MKIFERFKNIFTEEVVEEPIKKELTQVEIPAPKLREEEAVTDNVELKKEEKFVFPVYFDDNDFNTLEYKKEPVKKEEIKKDAYNGKKEEKKDKKFMPSPIISPVYGILDKNYHKEDVVNKADNKMSTKNTRNITLDDIRKKAFGTLEDDLENTLFRDEPYTESTPKNDVDLFEEISTEDEIEVSSKVNVVEDKMIDDFINEETDDFEDNMTLEELNKESKEDDLNITESDLFNLIDSMYEKGDEDNGNA